MNYIIEGGIDFYSEINKKEENSITDVEQEDDDEKCLITHQLLTLNFIKLSCGHKFNYLPLYKEICNQKKVLSNNAISYETYRLKINEIKCPYCRLKKNEILPYIQVYDESGNQQVDRIHGVNTPERFCMKTEVMCAWKFKQGKEQGEICSKNAYYNPHKININKNAYCDMHWKKVEVRNKSSEQKIEKNINKSKNILDEKWTDEMITYSKLKGIYELKEILRKNVLIVGGNKKALVQRIFEKKIEKL